MSRLDIFFEHGLSESGNLPQAWSDSENLFSERSFWVQEDIHQVLGVDTGVGIQVNNISL